MEKVQLPSILEYSIRRQVKLNCLKSALYTADLALNSDIKAHGYSPDFGSFAVDPLLYAELLILSQEYRHALAYLHAAKDLENTMSFRNAFQSHDIRPICTYCHSTMYMQSSDMPISTALCPLCHTIENIHLYPRADQITARLIECYYKLGEHDTILAIAEHYPISSLPFSILQCIARVYKTRCQHHHAAVIYSEMLSSNPECIELMGHLAQSDIQPSSVDILQHLLSRYSHPDQRVEGETQQYQQPDNHMQTGHSTLPSTSITSSGDASLSQYERPLIFQLINPLDSPPNYTPPPHSVTHPKFAEKMTQTFHTNSLTNQVSNEAAFDDIQSFERLASDRDGDRFSHTNRGSTPQGTPLSPIPLGENPDDSQLGIPPKRTRLSTGSASRGSYTPTVSVSTTPSLLTSHIVSAGSPSTPSLKTSSSKKEHPKRVSMRLSRKRSLTRTSYGADTPTSRVTPTHQRASLEGMYHHNQHYEQNDETGYDLDSSSLLLTHSTNQTLAASGRKLLAAVPPTASLEPRFSLIHSNANLLTQYIYHHVYPKLLDIYDSIAVFNYPHALKCVQSIQGNDRSDNATLAMSPSIFLTTLHGHISLQVKDSSYSYHLLSGLYRHHRHTTSGIDIYVFLLATLHNQPKEVCAIASRLLFDAPGTKETWLCAAISEVQKQSFPQAILFVDKALAIDPLHAFSWFIKAWVFGLQKSTDALRTLKHARNLFGCGRNMAIETAICAHYLSANQHKAAFDSAKEVHKKCVTNPKSLVLLGTIMAKNDNDDVRIKAQTAFESALAVDSGLTMATLSLAKLYTHRGRVDLAIECILKYIALSPPSAALHELLAQLYLATNKSDLALEHFNAALTIRPDYLPAQLGLRDLHAALLSGSSTGNTSGLQSHPHHDRVPGDVEDDDGRYSGVHEASSYSYHQQASDAHHRPTSHSLSNSMHIGLEDVI